MTSRAPPTSCPTTSNYASSASSSSARQPASRTIPACAKLSSITVPTATTMSQRASSYPLPPSPRSLQTSPCSTAPRATKPGTPTADIVPVVSRKPLFPLSLVPYSSSSPDRSMSRYSGPLSSVSYPGPIKSSPRLGSIRSLEEDAESSSALMIRYPPSPPKHPLIDCTHKHQQVSTYKVPAPHYGVPKKPPKSHSPLTPPL